MNLNKVFLIGNLTRDPETKALPSGQPVATFGLATNRVWKDKSGTKQTQAEFHNVVVFGRLAEIVQQYTSKGKMVLIEGRIQTRTWQAQDGQKRSRTEIIAESLQLGPRGQAGGSPVAEPPKQEEPPVDTIQYPGNGGEINPDEIPF
jgi:single-strand DNA-binding protein